MSTYCNYWNKVSLVKSKIKKTKKIDSIGIGLASPEEIRRWGERRLPNGTFIGKVDKDHTVDYESLKPIEGGLFCERIFGPVEDFYCSCERKGEKNEKFCPNCEVEFTKSRVRRIRMGYIPLAVPVVHVWYLRGRPSYIANLVGKSRNSIDRLAYGEALSESFIGSSSLESIYKKKENFFSKGRYNVDPSSSASLPQYPIPLHPSNASLVLGTGVLLPSNGATPLPSYARQAPVPASSAYPLPLRGMGKQALAGYALSGLAQFLLAKQYPCTQYERSVGGVKGYGVRSVGPFNAPLVRRGQKERRANGGWDPPTIRYMQSKGAFIQYPRGVKGYGLALRSPSFFCSASPSGVSPSKFNAPLLRYPSNASLVTRGKEQKYFKFHILPLFSTFVYKEWSHRFSFLEYFIWSARNNDLLLPFYAYQNSKSKIRLANINICESIRKNSINLIRNKFLLRFSNKSTFSLNVSNLYSRFAKGPDELVTRSNPFVLQEEKAEPRFLQLRNKQGILRFIKVDKLYTKSNFSDIRSAKDVKASYSIRVKDSSKNKNFLMEQDPTCGKPLKIEFCFATINDKYSFAIHHMRRKEAEIFTPGTLRYMSPASLLAKRWRGKGVWGTNASLVLGTGVLGYALTGSYPKGHTPLPLQGEMNAGVKKQEPLTQYPRGVKGYYSTTRYPFTPSGSGFEEQKDEMNVRIHFSRVAGKEAFTQYPREVKGYGLALRSLYPFVPRRVLTSEALEGYSPVPSLITKGKEVCYAFNTTQQNTESTLLNKIDTQQFPRLTELLSFTGGAALRNLLSRFDLIVLSKFLRHELKNLELKVNSLLALKMLTYSQGLLLGKLAKRRSKQIRRLKLLELFQSQKSNPEWMILSVIPVLPPDLRPILRVNDDFLVASDLNRLYQTVLRRNNTIHERLDDPLPCPESGLFRQRSLQKAVDGLLENGKGGGTPLCASKRRPLVSLSHVLKGKKGLFRQHLLGKRVDYSGRSVIVVGPRLQLHECGLPKEMAIELFQPFLLHRLKVKGLATSNTTARRMIQQGNPVIWHILKQLVYEHPVLLNRAPTLHRLGIQAFQPRLVSGRAILLHPLVCNGFNADFDGDQMAVHVPLSFQARAEAWKIMWSKNNFLSPATGQPILVPSQDMVLGCYYLSVSIPRILDVNVNAISQEQDTTNKETNRLDEYPLPFQGIGLLPLQGWLTHTPVPLWGLQSRGYRVCNMNVAPYPRGFDAPYPKGVLHSFQPVLAKRERACTTGYSFHSEMNVGLVKLGGYGHTPLGVKDQKKTKFPVKESVFLNKNKGQYFSNLQDSLLAYFQGRLQTHTPFWVRIDPVSFKITNNPKQLSSNHNVQLVNKPNADALKLTFLQPLYGSSREMCKTLFLNKNRNHFHIRVEANETLESPLELRLSIDGNLANILTMFQNHYNYNATWVKQCKEESIKYMRTTAGRVVINEAVFKNF